MFVASATRARLFPFTVCIFPSYRPDIPVRARRLHSPRQTSLYTALDRLFYPSPGFARLISDSILLIGNIASRHLHSSVTSNNKGLTADACEAPGPNSSLAPSRTSMASRHAVSKFGLLRRCHPTRAACPLVRRFARFFGRTHSKPDPGCCLAPPI